MLKLCHFKRREKSCKSQTLILLRFISTVEMTVWISDFSRKHLNWKMPKKRALKNNKKELFLLNANPIILRLNVFQKELKE